jgi:regulatory protein
MSLALKLLARRPQSVAELEERLRRKRDLDEETLKRVLKRLEELGYLDDRRFASAYASSRISARPLGAARIRNDLRRRKVSEEHTEMALNEAFAETSEESLIDRAIAKRIRVRGLPATRGESQKLLAHLIRQGFSLDLALRKIRELSGSTDL